MTNASKND